MLGLLPSPLLGRAVWAPVAHQLSRGGWSVVIASAAVTSPRTPSEALHAFVGALPADRDLVLIPHSNAGLYVPALAQQRRVVANVFVDAAVPPAHGSVRLAPPGLYDLLAERADDDGLLPPWTQWWDETDIAALFPDDQAREQVEREQHRLPLAYFSESLPVPEGWDNVPCAYLAFGETYAREQAQATNRGWPVRTLPGGHLHMLNDPKTVTAEICALLAAERMTDSRR